MKPLILLLFLSGCSVDRIDREAICKVECTNCEKAVLECRVDRNDKITETKINR